MKEEIVKDDAQTLDWCAICRRTSNMKWKKHVFTRSHQQQAIDFFMKRIKALQDACQQINSGESQIEQDYSWKCIFCQVKSEKVLEMIEHYAMKAHSQQLDQFCRHHRCDGDKKYRSQLILDTIQYRQLHAAHRSKIQRHTQQVAQEKEQKQNEIPAEQKRAIEEQHQAQARTREQFLSSVSSTLERVGPWTPKTESEVKSNTMGPQIKNTIARPKTLTSPDGILQNPAGFHEGKRVWGGGIVKVKKSEWIPWAIDLLVKQEKEASRFKQEQGEENEEMKRESSFTHRFTEYAKGERLTSVRCTWDKSLGNIHTGAVPPWMVSNEDEYRRCNERVIPEVIQPPIPQVQSQQRKPEKKVQDIFTKLNPEYGPDWLPNFGGVWQEGSRATTTKEFQQTQRKKLDTRVKAQNVKPVVSANLSYVASSGASQAVIKQEQQSKLDPKAKALMEQKVKLRAKFAAKRRGG